MKPSLYILVWILLFTSLVHTEESPPESLLTPPQTPAHQKLRKAIDSVFPPKGGVQIGILAVSLDRGEIIYEKNPDEKLIPASVSKVFTSYTALKALKPNATFKTYFYSNGTIKDQKLIGDLYLKGGGDPSLVSERLWMMVNEFMRHGIRTIQGNLIADASFYDGEIRPESRPKYLKDQAYNAPIGGLSFNFNTTTIYVRPGEKVGAPPIAYIDPDNTYIELVNQAKTSAKGGSNSLSVNRTEQVKGDLGDTVLLRGNIPQDSKELRFYRNIVNPSRYTAHMVKNFLEQRGVKFEGKIEEGTVPESAKLLVEFESLPLWQVIWGMNKFSNNFVADQLLKKMGAEAWGPPGTREKGLTVLYDKLEEIGIPKKSYQIQDGSGLTRETKVTPRHIVTVLMRAFYDFSMMPEFMASLGIAGEDGTLRNRLPNMREGGGIVRAKTGTLDGVTGLAGYVQTNEGERIAFAILLNDLKVKFGRMAPWADQIANLLAKFSRK